MLQLENTYMPYTTTSDGTHLYYETLGKETGEPLLLISGQGGDHTGWDGIRDDFAGRYRVIVFDHRGTGQSDKPSEPPYSTRGFAQDVIAILDHLNIPRAHAYGISMGGRICQWLGIDWPDRVGAAVERRSLARRRNIPLSDVGVTIRRATVADAAAVATIQVHGHRFAYAGILPQPLSDAGVVTVGQAIIVAGGRGPGGTRAAVGELVPSG